MPATDERTDVLRPQLQAAFVGFDRLVREGGWRERCTSQVMSLRVRWINRDRAVEAFERFSVAVLLFSELSQIEDGGQEIWRQRDRSLQQPFGFGLAARFHDDEREQSQRVDVA